MNHYVYWIALAVTVYALGYLGVTIFSRAKDINNNQRSRGETFVAGLLWPLAILYGVYYVLVEFPSQLLAKYLNRRDAKARNKKFGNVA